MTQLNGKNLKPFSLLIKPVGSRCNLDCSYCFYQGTDELLGDRRPPIMSHNILDRLVKDYLSLGFPTSVFVWQGGEPTLAGIDFYRHVVEKQMEYGTRGQAVGNALQTNGTLIDNHWSEFLSEYSFLVGLSLDGPPGVHNHYRTDKGGRPTFERVLAAADCLRRNMVEFNILCMITSQSESSGSEIYRFFVREGFNNLQFIPCVEYDHDTGAPSPYNVSSLGYGRFMCDVFDRWYEQDVGRVSIRTFDALVARLAGIEDISMCTMGKICDHYLVIEKAGDVFPCDFFVSPSYYMGNIGERSLAEIYLSDAERAFSSLKSRYQDECRMCPYLDLCHGGCPKDRLCTGGGSFGEVSALCEGLKHFFKHTNDRLRLLADSVPVQNQTKRDSHSGKDASVKVGRNDPCPCGSGKKYKHCCMR